MFLKASKVNAEGLRFFSGSIQKIFFGQLTKLCLPLISRWETFTSAVFMPETIRSLRGRISRLFQKLPASLRPTRPASHRVAKGALHILSLCGTAHPLRTRPRHFDGSRERPGRTAPRHAAREVLCSHGLCEQRALRQTKAQLTRGEKVGPVLDRIGDGACAHGIGEIDDSPAGCPFAAIARATGDELSSDLELDEGKIAKPR